MRELDPNLVWGYFNSLTCIPRPSGEEERAVEWLIEVAKRCGLAWRRDTTGNICITSPATSGHEDRPLVTLQAHLDMVCEKRSDSAHDFMSDPIETYIEDGWLRARGTTLGADCGIGVAAALAALTDPKLKHGVLEALFTLDEERGLTGAFGLGEGMIGGDILLNLDSEDEGEIFIGCAGGIDTIAQFEYHRDEPIEGARLYRIEVGGLLGGHSGDDINKGRGNAVKLLSQVVTSSSGRIVDIKVGNLRNAIPREGYADILVVGELDYRFESENPEAWIKVTDLGESDLQPINIESQRDLLEALNSVKSGVVAMSQSIEGLVETSTNLASVTLHEEYIEVVTSQRSSTIERRTEVQKMVAESLSKATVSHSDGYPGWSPNVNSRLLSVAQSCHKDLFGVEARVRAIHAGLECGLFLEQNPNLDMISFGPTMRDVHSPDERLEIASVGRFYQLLGRVIESI